jgi:hypothetical protein
MSFPVCDRAVKLNIPAQSFPIKRDDRVVKVRTAVAIQRSWLDNFQEASIDRCQPFGVKILPAPQMTEKVLVNFTIFHFDDAVLV